MSQAPIGYADQQTQDLSASSAISCHDLAPAVLALSLPLLLRCISVTAMETHGMGSRAVQLPLDVRGLVGVAAYYSTVLLLPVLVVLGWVTVVRGARLLHRVRIGVVVVLAAAIAAEAAMIVASGLSFGESPAIALAARTWAHAYLLFPAAAVAGIVSFALMKGWSVRWWELTAVLTWMAIAYFMTHVAGSIVNMATHHGQSPIAVHGSWMNLLITMPALAALATLLGLSVLPGLHRDPASAEGAGMPAHMLRTYLVGTLVALNAGAVMGLIGRAEGLDSVLASLGLSEGRYPWTPKDLIWSSKYVWAVIATVGSLALLRWAKAYRIVLAALVLLVATVTIFSVLRIAGDVGMGGTQAARWRLQWLGLIAVDLSATLVALMLMISPHVRRLIAPMRG